MSHVHSALAKLCFFTVFQSKCSTAHQGQLPPTGEGCVPGAEGQRSKVRFPIETHTCHTPAETPSSPQAASVYKKKKHKRKHKSNFIAFRLFSIGGHQGENSKTSVKLQPLQGQLPPVMRLMTNIWSHAIQLNLVAFHFLFSEGEFLNPIK